MATEYKLQVECGDLEVEVLVNDLPVFLQNAEIRTKNTLINHWLIDGHNYLTIRLKEDERSKANTANPFIELSIFANQESLYYFSWTTKDSKRTLPYTTRKNFISDNSFGEWIWQRADILELSDAIVIEINRFLQRVYDSLHLANIEETINLFRIKAEEQAIAFGISIEERFFQQRSFFEQWFSQVNWGMQKINFELLNYRLCGNNRVVFISYKDLSDVLESRPLEDGEMISFPLFISKIEGRWVIVR